MCTLFNYYQIHTKYKESNNNTASLQASIEGTHKLSSLITSIEAGNLLYGVLKVNFDLILQH